MEDSLSILLPVYNAGATLSDDVERVLEVAAELTRRVDLCIIDNGSSDHTEEVAWELATRYRNVACLRHPFRLGSLESVRSGLAEATGDYMLLFAGRGPLMPSQIARLWHQRHEDPTSYPEQAEAAVEDSSSDPHWLRRLLAWGRSLQEAEAPSASELLVSGWRLIHKCEVERLKTDLVFRRESYLERIRHGQRTRTIPALNLARPAPKVTSTAGA